MDVDRLVLETIMRHDGHWDYHALALSKQFIAPPLCNELFPALERLSRDGCCREIKKGDHAVLQMTAKGKELLAGKLD